MSDIVESGKKQLFKYKLTQIVQTEMSGELRDSLYVLHVSSPNDSDYKSVKVFKYYLSQNDIDSGKFSRKFTYFPEIVGFLSVDEMLVQDDFTFVLEDLPDILQKLTETAGRHIMKTEFIETEHIICI